MAELDRVFLEHLGGEGIQYNNEFDIVGMVLTFHEILPDVRIKVIEKAYQALKIEGKLFLFDFSYPDNIEDFKNPLYEPGVIDQFDETCLGVIHLSVHEQNEMLTEIGFNDIQRTSMQGFDFITATK